MHLRKKTKYDTVWFGLIIGSILPLIISVIVIMARSGEMDFIRYFKHTFAYGVYADMLRVSVLIDLLVFYFFLNREFYASTKGVIIGAVVVGLYVVYLKYL